MTSLQKNILIAEDERPMAKALELKLLHAFPDRLSIQTVHNGEEAILSLDATHPDLILLDLVMPKLDGFAVLQEIQRRDLHVPAIVLSNLGQEEDVKRAKSLGAIDYFIKSDTPIAQIVSLVQKVLSL